MPFSRNAPCLPDGGIVGIPKRSSSHVRCLFSVEQNGTPPHSHSLRPRPSALGIVMAAAQPGKGCSCKEGAKQAVALSCAYRDFGIRTCSGKSSTHHCSTTASPHPPRFVLQDQWARTAASRIPRQIDRSTGLAKFLPSHVAEVVINMMTQIRLGTGSASWTRS